MKDGRRVLSREDQVLHAVVHLFVDSDCTNRLRDLVDIAALLTQFRAEEGAFDERLERRSDVLGATWALDHATVFLNGWLDVSLPPRRSPASGAGARAARSIMARRLAPPDPDALPGRFDPARATLLGRSLWLRLPPRLALLHAATKAVRRLTPS